MSDLQQALTGSILNPQAISIWLITKMLARLWLLAIRVRLVTLIAPKAKLSWHEGLFHVDCGEWTLRLATNGSDQLPLVSKRRTRKPRSSGAASTSTVTTKPQTTVQALVASSSAALRAS